MSIPQASPKAAYMAQKEAIQKAVERVLESGWYILGREVEAFEAEFAEYCQARYAIGVANGTDAITLALKACGVQPGDEVITTTHTAVATVAAVELCGAVPVLIDINPRTYLIDVDQIAPRITPKTKAIIAVHLYGQPVALEKIQALCQSHNLVLVEDCAQAHGARIAGRRVGSLGSISTFSFYPTKNLGALGDGGAVLTSDPDLAQRVRELRQYGWRERYISFIPGGNSRLDELQAAMLRAKLPLLDAGNERRCQFAALYRERLKGTPLILPSTVPGTQPVYHLFVVRTPRRDELSLFLKEKGIGTGIHYPAPIHLQPAYLGRLAQAGDFPQAEAACREILSLPLYPEMSEEDVEQVCSAIKEFFN